MVSKKPRAESGPQPAPAAGRYRERAFNLASLRRVYSKNAMADAIEALCESAYNLGRAEAGLPASEPADPAAAAQQAFRDETGIEEFLICTGAFLKDAEGTSFEPGFYYSFDIQPWVGPFETPEAARLAAMAKLEDR